MIDRVGHPHGEEDVEAALHGELARGDAMAETLLPVLRHLVAAEDDSLFGEDILAHVRGMLADLANGLLDDPDQDEATRQRLFRALLDNPALLAHLHALALEWQLVQRLQARTALDPVVSPLLQALIASPDAETQGLAMTYLAAQARWCQAQRRMKLAWRELPGDLLHAALLSLRVTIGEAAAREDAEIRRSYDEAAGRLGLAARLVAGLEDGGRTALSLSHAGVSLFLTALALESGMARDAAVLSTHEAQAARLALGLRSAGLDLMLVREQLMMLHGHAALPIGFDRADRELAARVLSSNPPMAVGPA